MPRILAYHPVFAIRGAEDWLLSVDMRDWCPDREVLRRLAMAGGVETAGGLVEVAREGSWESSLEGVGCIAVRIEEVAGSIPDNACVLGWDDSI